MDKHQILDFLRSHSASEWHMLRRQQPDNWIPDLSDLDLEGFDLRNYDLSKANLCGTDLSAATLVGNKQYESGVENISVEIYAAKYDTTTKWPPGFDYKSMEAIPVPANRKTRGLIHFLSNQLKTNQQVFEELLDTLKGEIRVCDPYFGPGTLDRFVHLKQCQPFRFLTSNPANSVDNNTEHLQLRKWMTDNNIKMKLHNEGEIHDRYLLTKEQLVIVGHGLEDIGKKESFVMVIDAATVPELIKSVERSFDEKWERATTPKKMRKKPD
jgi:hypothetical protein